jgi:hypothetical protein
MRFLPKEFFIRYSIPFSIYTLKHVICNEVFDISAAPPVLIIPQSMHYRVIDTSEACATGVNDDNKVMPHKPLRNQKL